MSKPPNKNALLAVLRVALLDARHLARGGATDGLSGEQSRRIADLIDVVHNIPDILNGQEGFTEDQLLSELQWYDSLWSKGQYFQSLGSTYLAAC